MINEEEEKEKMEMENGYLNRQKTVFGKDRIM